MSGALVEAFATELEGFQHHQGLDHFTAENPLPAALVKRIVRARAEEVAARQGE